MRQLAVREVIVDATPELADIPAGTVYIVKPG